MSVRVPCTIAAATLVACAFVVSLRVLYLQDAWQNATVVNWLVAWIPFAVSILLAFIPDKDMKRATRVKWRVAVIACGLGYSILLWHQQTLGQKLATKEQAGLLTEAVNSANQHSDQQIAEVRKDVKGVKTDVQGVKVDVQDVKNAVSQSTSSISKSIGEVKLPSNEKASCDVSFWPATIRDWPIHEKSLALVNGVVTFSFSFKCKDHMAKQTRLWLRLCTDCKYAKEPPGFQNLHSPDQGGEPTERILVVGDFLPNVAYSPINVDVLPAPGPTSFLVGVIIGCENCDPVDSDHPQVLVVHIQP